MRGTYQRGQAVAIKGVSHQRGQAVVGLGCRLNRAFMPFLTTPCRCYGLTPFDGKPLLLPQFFAEFLDLGVQGADLAAHLLVVLGFLGEDEF